MSRLDTEFIFNDGSFISVNEDKLETIILEKLHNNSIEYNSKYELDQFSTYRYAVFEWYPFMQGKEILELGAGMGAITEYLLTRGCHVTSVEVKQKRCEIIKCRTKNYNNIDIICDNPALFSTKLKYDYIIVHDIWGFIKKYTRNDDGYNIFLQTQKSRLKKGGQLLIVADNRFALKYFSGSYDEYTKKMYSGLNKYKGYSYVSSFSKRELKEILERNGFNSYTFFYINSDYHFVDKIYSDSSLNEINYRVGIRSGTNPGFDYFDRQSVYNEFQKDGILDRFVDSFFIVCGDIPSNVESFFYYDSDIKKIHNYKIIINKMDGEYIISKIFSNGHIEENRVKSLDKINDLLCDGNHNEYIYDIKPSNFPITDVVDILSTDTNYINDENENIIIEEQELINRVLEEIHGGY